MSTRTRLGLGGSATIQYEDFQPKSEWNEEEGANILLVHLPEFLKEQLKITYVHSSQIVRVTGERPIAYSKWRRFNQTFPVPQNCDVNKIQGKFQNGALIITMPKATITTPPPKEETEPIKEAAPLPSKEAPAEKTKTSQVSQKPTMEPKEQKKTEETASLGSQKQGDEKKLESLSPQEALKDQKSQMGPVETPSKVVSTTDTMKQKDHEKKGQASTAETVDQKPMIRKRESAAEASKKPTEPSNEKPLSEHEESTKKRKESITAESDESSKKRKETTLLDDKAPLKTPDMEKDKAKAQDFKVAGKVEKLKGVAAAAAEKTRKGLTTMELSEDRQSMVNIGVAVLVIVAVGAYMVYSYRSSGTSSKE